MDDVLQRGDRDFADQRRPERLGLAAVLSGTERIQAHQLAGQVEADDLFLAVAVDGDGLEVSFTRHIQGVHRVADPVQALAARQWPMAAHDGVEPIQIIVVDAGRQAELVQRALRAAAAQAR